MLRSNHWVEFGFTTTSLRLAMGLFAAKPLAHDIEAAGRTQAEIETSSNGWNASNGKYPMGHAEEFREYHRINLIKN
jgi:hypothetical protein